jgi:hypothetical protein
VEVAKISIFQTHFLGLIAVAARNIFGWVGRHFNVIITFFIMFVVITGKQFLC